MPQIPQSPGVLQSPNTETGVRPQSVAQTQVLPNAITQLGANIVGVGFSGLSLERREKEEYQVSQALDIKNQLRRFDNDQKIKLKELPANQQVINETKNQLLEERAMFFEELSSSAGDDSRLQKALKRDFETSSTNFEFGIDNELVNKRKTYNTNALFGQINSLKDRFETASDDEDFATIAGDLNEVLSFGMSTGIVNAKDIDRQQNTFTKLREDRLIQLDRDRTFAGVISGTIQLDATNRDDQKLINDNYSDLVLRGADPEKLAEQLSVQTGIVPPQAKRVWSANLFNGNNQQKLDAALTITDLTDDNVSLQNQFSKQEIALSQEISTRYSAGVPLDNIIKFAEADIKQAKSTDRILRNAQFEQEFPKSGKNLVKSVESIRDNLQDRSGVFFEAEVPTAMVNDVRLISRDYFINEGVGMEAAKDLAIKDVEGEWAVTKIGERRYQKYAPEVFYPQSGSKWIQNQAIQEVRKTTVEELPDIKKQIRLQVVPETIQTGAPSYYIYKTNDFGAVEPVLDNRNMPLVMKPDYKKSQDYKDQQEQIAKLSLTPEKEAEFIKKRNLARTRKAKEKKLGTSDPLTLLRIGVPPKGDR